MTILKSVDIKKEKKFLHFSERPEKRSRPLCTWPETTIFCKNIMLRDLKKVIPTIILYICCWLCKIAYYENSFCNILLPELVNCSKYFVLLSQFSQMLLNCCDIKLLGSFEQIKLVSIKQFNKTEKFESILQKQNCCRDNEEPPLVLKIIYSKRICPQFLNRKFKICWQFLCI